jgi:hypothetical protein
MKENPSLSPAGNQKGTVKKSEKGPSPKPRPPARGAAAGFSPVHLFF